MALEVISVKCPECGADLSEDVSGGRETVFCRYCGTKILLSNENEHIYRNIDEARIREAELERDLRIREMELEEREKLRGRKGQMVGYCVALLFTLGGALMAFLGMEAAALGIVIGMNIAMLVFTKSIGESGRKRKTAGPGEVQISEPMRNCEGKDHNSICLLFRSAGFTNITEIPLNNLTVFNQKKNGKVESVTINGSDRFRGGETVSRDVPVLITYHSKG